MLNLIEVKGECEESKISFTGFISRGDSGSFRKDNQFQFIYLNKRPVDISEIMKYMNETYRSMFPFIIKNNQYPIFILNIIMDTVNVDINITPDKRKVIVEDMDKVISLIQVCVFSPLFVSF